MIGISVRAARLVFFGVATILGSPLAIGPRAQCLDWAYGFGPTDNGLSGEPYAMTVFNDGGGSQLFVAGAFTHAGGALVNNVAKWNGSTWSSVGAGFNADPFALASFNDGSGSALYATGYMLQSGPTPLNYLARWNGTAWSSAGGGLSNPGKALAVFNDGTGDALYVGGAFTTVGGVSANKIAKWDGTTWTALGTGLNGDVEALAVYNDGTGPTLYAAGSFTTAGGVSAIHIARWDGTTWSGIGPVNGDVYALTAYDSGSGPSLYVGGQFTFVGGSVAANNIARWNGTSWFRVGGTSGGGGTNGRVRSLAVSSVGGSSALYVGGAFGGGQGFTANRIAKWNGTTWSALGTGLEPQGFDAGRAICGFDDGSGERLFVGGSISAAGGKAAAYIANWGVACTAPIIVAQPTDQVAVFEQPAVFSVVADATAPVTYQWKRNGVNLIDGGSSVIEGATTPTLTIFAWSFDNDGVYTVVITNSLGSVTSVPARLTVPAGGVTGEPVTLTRVVYPPEPVVNLPAGNNYTRVSAPAVSSSGEALCYTEINGGVNGGIRSLSMWSNGASQLLYKAGDQAPGLPAGVFFSVSSFLPAFRSWDNASNGRFTFRSPIEGPGVDISNRECLWYRDTSGTTLVARSGDQPAGVPTGAVFNNNLGKPRTGDAGHITYSGGVTESGSPSYTGIWDWDPTSGSTLLARSFAPAPGTTANFVGLSWPGATNDVGETLFYAYLDSSTGFNYSAYDDTGLWLGTPGAVQLLAKSGDAAPGYAAGVNLELLGDGQFVLNNNGDVVFKTMVAGPSRFRANALYEASQGVLTRIAYQGMAAPGASPGETFIAPLPVNINNNGTVLFTSELQQDCSPTCPTTGLWIVQSGTITPILLDNSGPLPGLPAGFDLVQIVAVALNDLDQVVFQCEVSNGHGFQAVYGWTEQDGVFPIALPGAQFEVSPGQYRTALGGSIDVLDANPNGTSTSLTNSGLTVLSIGFTNGTAGVFAAQFQNLESLYFPPGETFCFGDGSLPTPCPCAPPNLVPNPSGAPDAGCANSFNLDGGKLMVAGNTTPDSIRFTGRIAPNYAAFGLLIKGNATDSAGVAVADGIRCAGGAIVRFGGHYAGTNGAAPGTWTYPNSVQTNSVSVATAQGPAQHAYYQFYYRNAAPNFCSAATANLSNGIDIAWP